MTDTSTGKTQGRRKQEKTTNKMLENLSAQSRKRERKVADVMTGDIATADTERQANEPDRTSQADPVTQMPVAEKPNGRLGRPSLGIAKEKLTVALVPEVKKEIKLQAVMHHTTPGNIIEQAMEEWMVKHGKS